MRSAVKIALLACLLPVTALACAQVFRVQAGGSTLLDAEGGSVQFTAPNYDGTVGMGVHDGKFAFGAETKYKYRGNVLLLGDDSVPFNLPTDIFNSSHYFFARGAGLLRSNDEQRLYAFGGTTSTWLGTGFFNSATADDPVGILFYDRKLTDTFKFVSRNIASKRQTSLQSLEWMPDKHVKTSLTGGVGSNQHYFASSTDIQSSQFAVKASYVAAGDMFRRVSVDNPMTSEVNKDNIEVLYKPSEHFSVTTGHQNILQPLTLTGPMEQASVNELVTSFRVERVSFGAGMFDSQTTGRTTQGANFFVSRPLGQRFDVSANYFDSRTKNQKNTAILSGMIRENLSHRFSLLQLVSRSAGQTTVAFGGSVTSNRVILSVDYQNVYLPFRPDRPFEQALAFNADLRVSGPLHVTALSNVAPDGHVRYSFGLSTYLYRGRGGDRLGAPPPALKRGILRFIVQGTVRDEKGTPIEGAALHIGREIAYTDSTGHLMIRFGKPGPFPIRLAADEFTTPGIYELVSAPGEVTAQAEGSATNVEVVVRRVVAQPSTQTAQKPATGNTPITNNLGADKPGPEAAPKAGVATPISTNVNSSGQKPIGASTPVTENLNGEKSGAEAAPSSKTPASSPMFQQSQ